MYLVQAVHATHLCYVLLCVCVLVGCLSERRVASNLQTKGDENSFILKSCSSAELLFSSIGSPETLSHLSCSSPAPSLTCPENAAYSKGDILFKLTVTAVGPSLAHSMKTAMAQAASFTVRVLNKYFWGCGLHWWEWSTEPLNLASWFDMRTLRQIKILQWCSKKVVSCFIEKF